MSSAKFGVTVRNSLATTIYGLCVVHICGHHLDYYFLPSLAAGADGIQVTWETFSGDDDLYYITFGYQASVAGIEGAVVMQGSTKCNATHSPKTMYVHVTPNNFRIQYNDKECSAVDYEKTAVIYSPAPDEADRAQSDDASLMQPRSNPFEMIFTNSNNYSVQVILSHMATVGEPTSQMFQLGAYTTAPALSCYNYRLGGDLYTMVFMAEKVMYLGYVSTAWNGWASQIVLSARRSGDGAGEMTTKYSNEPEATSTKFWTSREY